MPIISRTLTKLANREDVGPDYKCWRVDGINADGSRWVHRFAFPMTQAEAEALMPNVWSQEMLDEHEEVRGIKWIEEGNPPETFTRHDLSLTEWRRKVARRFWRATIDEDRKFLEKIAPYIAGFTANQIAAVLTIPVARAQIILDRAIKIRDTLTADMADVDATAEKS